MNKLVTLLVILSLSTWADISVAKDQGRMPLLERHTIMVPGEQWSAAFESVPLKIILERNEPDKFYYVATAETLNASLTFETPPCPVDDDPMQVFNCYREGIIANPGFVAETLVIKQLPDAVFAAYVTYAPVEDKFLKVVNSHIFFARNGKWGDLHLSAIKPDMVTTLVLFGIQKNFELVTDENDL